MENVKQFVEILGRVRMTDSGFFDFRSDNEDDDDNNERKYNMPNLARVNGHG